MEHDLERCGGHHRPGHIAGRIRYRDSLHRVGRIQAQRMGTRTLRSLHPRRVGHGGLRSRRPLGRKGRLAQVEERSHRHRNRAGARVLRKSGRPEDPGQARSASQNSTPGHVPAQPDPEIHNRSQELQRIPQGLDAQGQPEDPRRNRQTRRDGRQPGQRDPQETRSPTRLRWRAQQWTQGNHQQLRRRPSHRGSHPRHRQALRELSQTTPSH